MKKKISLVFFIVLILFSLFSNCFVKATTYEEYSAIYEKLDHYFGIQYDSYHYFTYWLNNRFYYCYITNIDKSVPIYMVRGNSGNLLVYNVATQEQMSYVIKVKEFLKIDYNGYNSDNINSITTDFTSFNYSASNIPVHSDFTTYNSDNTVFFRLTPLVVVRPMLERVLLKEVMKEVLGILPLILNVVVSLIALRKAWKVLYNFLKTS